MTDDGEDAIFGMVEGFELVVLLSDDFVLTACVIEETEAKEGKKPN